MRIATWNVNGMRAREAEFLEWVTVDRPDIVCLQEIKAEPTQLSAHLCNLSNYRCYWHGGKGYSGVALHLRKDAFPDDPSFSHPDFDHEHRIVEVELGATIVASIYVPNGGKDFPAKMRFLEALDRHVLALHAAGKTVVLCGDFNVTREERDVHPQERKPGAIGQRPEERELFARILSRGLEDLGRAFDPDNDSLFTWWAPWRNMRHRNIGWRLDYVLASRELIAKRCEVFPEIGTSDHAPVVAELTLA